MPLSGIERVGFVAFVVTVMVPDAAPVAVGAKVAVNVACAPAAIVCPSLSPLAVNPVPSVLTWLTVTVPAPEFFRVMVCGLVDPTTTLLKLTLPGLAESVPSAATALPINTKVCGVPGALSANTTLPLTPVVEVGANCTEKVTFCPAVRVFGTARPLMANPVPETVAEETVRSALPVFVRVTFCELDCPTVMLLNVSAEGLSENAGCMPVPLSEIVSDGLVALLTIVRVPEAVPADWGANCTCTVALWPAGIVEEGSPPTTLNAAPEIVADEMATLAEPVFVMVRLSELLPPTATLPKPSVLALAESVPAVELLVVWLAAFVV